MLKNDQELRDSEKQKELNKYVNKLKKESEVIPINARSQMLNFSKML